jgi:hypothetical protein
VAARGLPPPIVAEHRRGRRAWSAELTIEEACEGHRPATIVPAEFDPQHRPCPRPEGHSMSWLHHDDWMDRRNMPRDAGRHLAESLRHIVRDVLTDFGIDGLAVFLGPACDLFRRRSDFFFVWRLGADRASEPARIVGVVQRYGPTRGALDDPLVAGQMFDRLIALRAYHGIARPVALATTHCRWRVFWLPDQDGRDGGRDPRAGLHVLGDAERVVCASEAYDAADFMTVRVLARALHRMRESAADGAGPHDGAGALRVLVDPVQWRWVRFPHGASPDSGSPDTEDPPRFILERDLGAGGDGHAWSAVRVSCGRRCAIKWSHADDGDRPPTAPHAGAAVEPDLAREGGALWREAALWRLLWDATEATAMRLAGRPALVMPYVEPLLEPQGRSKDDAAKDRLRSDTALRQDVMVAVEKVAAHGLYHADLSWRHVGRWTPGPGQPPRIVFFDLARMGRAEPTEARRIMEACLYDDDDDDDAAGCPV